MFLMYYQTEDKVRMFHSTVVRHSDGVGQDSAHEVEALVPCVEAEGNRAFLWKDAGKDNLTSMPMVSGEILHKFP